MVIKYYELKKAMGTVSLKEERTSGQGGKSNASRAGWNELSSCIQQYALVSDSHRLLAAFVNDIAQMPPTDGLDGSGDGWVETVDVSSSTPDTDLKMKAAAAEALRQRRFKKDPNIKGVHHAKTNICFNHSNNFCDRGASCKFVHELGEGGRSCYVCGSASHLARNCPDMALQHKAGLFTSSAMETGNTKPHSTNDSDSRPKKRSLAEMEDSAPTTATGVPASSVKIGPGGVVTIGTVPGSAARPPANTLSVLELSRLKQRTKNVSRSFAGRGGNEL